MHRTPATQHLSFSYNALILLSWNVLLLSSSQGPVNRPFSLNSSLTFPVLCSLQFFWTFTALAICTSLTSGYKLQWSAFCCLTGQPLNQIANFKMKLGPWPLLWICAPYILHEHSSWYQKKKRKDRFCLIHFNFIFFAIWSTVIITTTEKARGAQTVELF